MKNGAAVIAITFLTVGSLLAQVHIRESTVITPREGKIAQEVNNPHKFHIEVIQTYPTPIRFEVAGTCTDTVLGSVGLRLVADIGPVRADDYWFDVSVCGSTSLDNPDTMTVGVFFDDSTLFEQTHLSPYWMGGCFPMSQFWDCRFTTPYFSTFDFTLAKHQFISGDTTGMSLNGRNDCSETAWSTTDPLTLTIVTGNQYVSFHQRDSQTGGDTKLGSTISATGNSIGQYVLVADGAPPDSINSWATIQAESNGMTRVDSVQILPFVDHFYVYAQPDTIDDSATAKIYVQAKDAIDEDMDYDGNVRISASPSQYGDLNVEMLSAMKKGGMNGNHKTMSISSVKGASSRGSEDSNIPERRSLAAMDSVLETDYWTANWGRVFYTADGTVPDSNMTITFTVMSVDQTSVTGKGQVVILSPYQLDVKYPTDAQKITGDNPPKMPEVSGKIKAQLHAKKNIPVTYNWEMKIKWTGKGGWKTPQNDEAYSGDTTGETNKWTPLNVNLSKYIRGGQIVTLKVVAATTDYSTTKSYDTTFAIKGTNPTFANMLAALNGLQYEAIASYESNFNQFAKSRRVQCDTTPSYPLQGGKTPADFGIMQIDSPQTDDIIWNWTVNVQTGKDMFDARYNAAATYHEDFAGSSPLNEDEKIVEAYCEYNGGPGAWYWKWIQGDPSQNGPGYWEEQTQSFITAKAYADNVFALYKSHPWR